MKKTLFIITISFMLHFLSITAFAQTTPTPTGGTDFGLGVANLITISDKSAKDGDIVTFSNKGYKLADRAYDPQIFGIITDNPAVTLERKTTNDGTQRYVITTGKAYVRVSTQNGPIKAGDLVATSKVEGIGQKASQDGYVVGTALEGYEKKNQEAVGKNPISLKFAFQSKVTGLRTNLLDNFNLALNAPLLSPW